jgi:hypothetical protein
VRRLIILINKEVICNRILRYNIIYIYICLYSPFLGLGCFLFLSLLHVRQVILDEGSARPRPPSIHRTPQPQNKRDTHPCLEWDSNPRFQCSSDEDISCPRPRGHCDRHVWLRKIFGAEKTRYNVEHYQGYQNRKDGLGRACSTHWRN